MKRNLVIRTADSLAANNIVLGTYRHITAPGAASTCCARRSRRRSTERLPYIAESLGGRERDLRAYQEVKCIRDKDDFLIPFIKHAHRYHVQDRDRGDRPRADAKLDRLRVPDGRAFSTWARAILSLGPRTRCGCAEQYQYILREESMHCNFGIDLINTIKLENPQLWTQEFRRESPSYSQGG